MSAHFQVVHLAYEWHVLPSDVLKESPRMQATMMRYLRWRATREAEE